MEENIIGLTTIKKQYFLNYCTTLKYSKRTKSSILYYFSTVNDFEYLIYPLLFRSKKISESIENMICFASYFIYSSLNLKDKVLDNQCKEADKNKHTLLSNIFQKEGIKILKSLTFIKNSFWETWKEKKTELKRAQIIDKNYNSNKQITWAQYMILAEYRSTFAKIAIEIWNEMSHGNSCQNEYFSLLESHRNYSVGLQISDDILDIKEDIVNSQINIATQTLRQELETLNIKYQKLDHRELLEHFYTKGIAIKLLERCIYYYKKSKNNLSNNLNKYPLWIQQIEIKENKARSGILIIEEYIKKINIQSTISNEYVKINNVEQSIVWSFKYIKSKQNENGSWLEIYNNAGMSNIWSTGFILNQLPNTNENINFITNACNYLKNNKQGELWGYNNRWISDIDSSTCVLLALSKNNIDISSEFQIWKNLQKQNGGFSTYSDSYELIKSLGFVYENVKGWTMSHICVSALAFKLLLKHNKKSKTTSKLWSYIEAQQREDFQWDSYWWTSPIYSTSIILEALIEDDNENVFKYKKNIDKLVSNISNSGLVIDMLGESNMFYTAMIIIVLCSSKEIFNKYEYTIEKSIDSLVKNQFNDGSFSPSMSLRIPSPQIIDCNEVIKWGVKNEKTNVIIPEIQRLFTTSTCLKAIDRYKNLKRYDNSEY